MYIFQNLEPQEVWFYFREVLEIPRPSKKEEKIISYLTAFAEKHGLEWKQDKAGNLLIRKNPVKGLENKPVIVLQSHLDMVCEKNSGTEHDFEKDPIIPKIEGEWVKAEGTTLGADDGIGIAAQLAILASRDLMHGPVECLFTIDEESGLTGAMSLGEGFFEGKTLLNLDSEDEGEFFIGCAGGKDTVARLNYRQEYLQGDFKAFEISVSGLTGGHSGDEIHKGQGNSIKLLNRFLWEALRKVNMRLLWFDGGNLRNAIPREAKAIAAVPGNDAEAFTNLFNEYSSVVKDELRLREPNPVLKISETAVPDTCIDHTSMHALLSSLYACPHGVIEWSREIPDLVETSTNLASVKQTDHSSFIITTSQRSSRESAKIDTSNMVRAVFELAGAEVEHSHGYPGWSPDKNSFVLNSMEKLYLELFGQKPKVKAIHAGLECGLFLEKYKGLDMISFGPTIKGAHSPDERLHIPSVEKFWKLLTAYLERV